MSLTFTIGGIDVVHYYHHPKPVELEGTIPVQFAIGKAGNAKSMSLGDLVPRDQTGAAIALEVQPNGAHNGVWLPEVIALADFGAEVGVVPMFSYEVIDLLSAFAEYKETFELLLAQSLAAQAAAEAAAASIDTSGGFVTYTYLNATLAERDARARGVVIRKVYDPTIPGFPALTGPDGCYFDVVTPGIEPPGLSDGDSVLDYGP